MAANPITDATGNPIFAVIIVAVILVVVISFRLLMMRHPGMMRAKCPKCGSVFDASRMFSGIHLGPYKQLRCPACGKTSFMNSYVRDPINYPPPEQKSVEAPRLSDEELKEKRIEDSKYEKP